MSGEKVLLVCDDPVLADKIAANWTQRCGFNVTVYSQGEALGEPRGAFGYIRAFSGTAGLVRRLRRNYYPARDLALYADND